MSESTTKTISATPGVAEIVEKMLAKITFLRSVPNAKNYIEWSLSTVDGKSVHVTIQRPNGKTPSQLLNEAKQQLRQVNIALGMHECKALDCETWMSHGAPEFCPEHNDKNP